VVQENIKVIYVLLQNHGFASIGALSESHGSQRFGTKYNRRGPDGRLDGDPMPVDIARNAASWGLEVVEVSTIDEFRAALAQAMAGDRAVMIHIETDLTGPNPPATAWWDVPVAQTSTLDSTQQAYREYTDMKRSQRRYM
jgi:3D-(3,5/4)-trihydroxycyclohexane-1,2-dione acylhydrolase (decyclizing)